MRKVFLVVKLLVVTNNKVGRPSGTTAPQSDAVFRVREALGDVQTEFAAKLGLAPSSLSRLERAGRLPSNRAVMGKLRELALEAQNKTGEKIEL